MKTVFGGKRNQEDEDEGDLPEILHGYEIDERLGQGSYGCVYLVRNVESKGPYAMKVVDLIDNEVTKGLAREISILYTIEHENIVRLEQVFNYKNSMCIVMEYVTQDLNAYMQLQGRPNRPKAWLKQMLNALAYLHNRNIIHRDLKPENILVADDGMLKLADFGSAREWFQADVNLTPQVTTLAYRAPELLLGSEIYTAANDIWSLGCIFAEFEMLEPLFQEFDYETQNELSTISLIFRKLGTPIEQSWPGVSTLPNFPDEMPTYPQAVEVVSTLDAMGNDLLMQMLSCDPERRITAERALTHPYLLGV